MISNKKYFGNTLSTLEFLVNHSIEQLQLIFTISKLMFL